ncbi:MAG: hypothetical protein JRF59_15120 [Deltaproteobacteria bacterium]|nr:hypothetical protein [Deltaproteobacteria bacterium]MBW2101420.1 hypothetical protein [Deltaproteobacteria bacterium]MBW2349145.1 hypothetical protein [Deltaproteobacteria bacterium]RLB36963.1 MAG: hypothetical protein DRH20_08705 [Deltaproteobacteria bacterium]
MSDEHATPVLFRGVILGIPRDAFDKLNRTYEQLKDKEKIFISEAHWGDAEGGRLVLDFTLRRDDSYGVAHLERDFFQGIADAISNDGYGLLLFVGEKITDLAFIFFGRGVYEWRPLRSEAPSWWSRERMNPADWEKLFEF